MRRSKPWTVLLLAVLALVVGCGDESDPGSPDTADSVKTIALLRAAQNSPSLEAGFFAELKRVGWVEGRNLTILARQAEEVYSDPEQAAVAVERWARQGAELFVVFSSAGARIVMETIPDVPILFISNDPSAIGLVENEERPEGRATGVTFRVPADRTLDLTMRAIPKLDRVGILFEEGDPTSGVHREAIERAATDLGVDYVTAGWSQPDELAEAVAELADSGADGIVLSNSPGIVSVLDAFEMQARQHRLPVVVNTSIVPWAVVAVFPDPEDLGRQLARQTARVLAGSSPSAVPVEDPRNIHVRINPGAATELGIEVPEGLLREATEVISE